MVEHKEHGISLGISRVDNTFFMKMKLIGTLTHEDYRVMIPMIENAIKGVENPKIKVLVDATEFNGWELRAAWDDLRFGLKHSDDFDKIAFVGNKKWEEYGIKISNWFMGGEMKYFEDIEKAMEWINQKEDKEKKDVIQKELSSREEEIKKSLEALFKANMKITDWDVPEADDEEAAKILIDIFAKKVEEIREDIKNGKYKNY